MVKKINFSGTKTLSIITISVICFVYIFQIFNKNKYKDPNSVIAWDVISYYAYLPATFIEKDYTLSFLDAGKTVTGTYWPEKTKDGKYVIKTTMGLAIMYSPFFGAAHIIAPSFGFEANGFTQPYALALQLSGIFYVIIGLFFVRSILLSYFSDKISTIVLIIIGLTTNLAWYSTVEAPMSHSYSFCLFAIFAYLTAKWHNQPKFINSLLVGLTFGLISLIRPTNSLIALFFIFYNVNSFQTLKDKLHLYVKKYAYILVIAFVAFLVCLPQFLYWKSITGHFIYFSYGTDERFFFAAPKIFKLFFSFRKGWLLYTPVMIFALLGFFFMFKNDTKKYALGTILFFIVNIYVVSSWWCWWYGGSFVMRALIETYAVLAIPMAAFFSYIYRQSVKKRIILAIPIIAISLQSMFHTVQYYYGSIHWDSMTKEAYFDSFWRIWATNNFKNLLEAPDYENARKGIR